MLRTSIVVTALLFAGFAAPMAAAGEREGHGGRTRRRIEVGRSSHARHVYRPGHRFIRGHYELVTRKVWVPGYYRTEEIPAVYSEILGKYGKIKFVLVRTACVRKVWVPGYHKTKQVRVWVPGRFVRFGHAGHGRQR